jgi:hypothetical protein
VDRTAVFSTDRKFRYLLSRKWGVGPILAFVGLNPSTANEQTDDPTVRRCVAFARAWGYSAVHVVNLFAIVSADPSVLRKPDCIGPDNDQYLARLAVHGDKVIAAWGNHGADYFDRVSTVRHILNNFRDLYCFSKNKTGQPIHPLYVRMVPEGSLSIYSPVIDHKGGQDDQVHRMPVPQA